MSPNNEPKYDIDSKPPLPIIGNISIFLMTLFFSIFRLPIDKILNMEYGDPLSTFTNPPGRVPVRAFV